MSASSWLAATAALVSFAVARPARAEDQAADQSELWHMRATFMPPFARSGLRNGEEFYSLLTTRVGLGVRAPNGVWAEAAGGATRGAHDLGWDASLVAGGTVGRVAPDPGEWTLTAPVFLGYRFSKRPASSPTDGTSPFEDLHMMVVGARGALTRWASGANGLELGVELSLSVPFAKDEPTSPYYGDGPTHTIVEAGLYIAWLIEAPS
jgi:hypothetical protein